VNLLQDWLNEPTQPYFSETILIIIGLMISYILTTILWGLWFLLSLCKRRLLGTTNVDRGTGIPEDKIGDFHMKYDYIKLKNTVVGDRITKLKAQIHMSGVLILGFGLSFLINAIIPCALHESFDIPRIVFGVILLTSMFGSLGGWSHFIHHTKTEVENNAYLLDCRNTMTLTLLFDFDGTLVDLDRLQAYEGLVVKYTGSDNPDIARTLYEEDIELCKQGIYDRAEVFKNHVDQFPGVSVEKFCQDFWKEATRTQRIKHNCHETLRRLQVQGHMIFCVTDADGQGGNKFRRIAATDLVKYFEKVFIGTENVPFQKGGVEYLNWIINELCVSRSRCVMIGDKVEVDLEPAKRVGMSSILVRNKEYPGDWDLKVESLSELIPIIEGLV